MYSKVLFLFTCILPSRRMRRGRLLRRTRRRNCRGDRDGHAAGLSGRARGMRSRRKCWANRSSISSRRSIRTARSRCRFSISRSTLNASVNAIFERKSQSSSRNTSRMRRSAFASPTAEPAAGNYLRRGAHAAAGGFNATLNAARTALVSGGVTDKAGG